MMDAASALLFLAQLLPAPSSFGDTIVVTASRVEQRAGEVPASVTVLSREAVERSPAATLDDLLRQVPGFSLFRRTSSLVAHPTTQGVSLRGIGPSGSSRALVLVDGVPLNDPFGGWVPWNRVPLLAIDRVEVVRGGGANLWGNAALGGAIHVLTAGPEAGLRAAAEIGDHGTRSAAAVVGHRADRWGLSLAGSVFETDGWEVVRKDQRGAIDVPAFSENRTLTGKLEAAAGPALVTVGAGFFREERGNGTPLTGNGTEAGHAGVTLAAGTWQASAFGRRQSFDSTFSAQAPDRAGELPSLDQFDVAADEAGAALQRSWSAGERHRLTAGLDARRVRGTNREDFRFVDGRFTSRRAAGGEHLLAGLWFQDVLTPAPAWQVALGGRLDSWQSRASFRRERSLETGEPLRDEAFPDRDHLAFHPRLGVLHQAGGGLTVRAALARSFRAPTLNEQLRPFRVRNDITEANAALRPERLTSSELGIDLQRGRLTAALTGFWSELSDPVANVTVGEGTGAAVAPCGFVPEGGVCRQRRNLGSARIRGLEGEVRFRPRAAWELGASGLWTDARVTDPADARGLEGKRLAQVPRWQAVLQGAYTGRILLSLQARAVGPQFEDDLNTLPLEGFEVLDLAASYPLRKGWEIALAAENLGGATVEAGRTAEGLVTVGTPRLLRVGLRFRPGLQ